MRHLIIQTTRCPGTRLGLVAAIATAVSPALRAQPARFQGLGTLPGTQRSFPSAVSADGGTVLGSSDGLGFRWTAASGMVGFGGLGFVPYSASADGSMLVGVVIEYPHVEAARWTTETGVVLQGFPHGPYSDSTSAAGVSANGQTMVGGASQETSTQCWSPDGPPGGTYYYLHRFRGFVQAAPQGPLQLLGPLHGYSSCAAQAVSGDGFRIVGDSYDESCHGSLAFQACLWVDGGNPIALGFLPGEINSSAYAVSADGSTVVGTSGGISLDKAFRWTLDRGMVELGELPGGSSSSVARAVSANGGVIVGDCSAAGAIVPFIWDETYGMRDLRALLSDLGVNLDGWTEMSPVAISADGLTIVGNGRNPAFESEGWLAFLGDPLPPPCPGDANGDRAIDLSDLAILLTHFGTASGATLSDGDLDADGDVDLNDLAELLANFGVLCP